MDDEQSFLDNSLSYSRGLLLVSGLQFKMSDPKHGLCLYTGKLNPIPSLLRFIMLGGECHLLYDNGTPWAQERNDAAMHNYRWLGYAVTPDFDNLVALVSCRNRRTEIAICCKVDGEWVLDLPKLLDLYCMFRR